MSGTVFHMLCAGAAQGLVEALRPRFEADTGASLQARFGAVGAMKEALLAGEPCDLLIVTEAMIDALVADGLCRARPRPRSAVWRPASRCAPANRCRTSPPARPSPRRCMRASALYIPDPQRATAGIHFAGVVRALGLDERSPTRAQLSQRRDRDARAGDWHRRERDRLHPSQRDPAHRGADSRGRIALAVRAHHRLCDGRHRWSTAAGTGPALGRAALGARDAGCEGTRRLFVRRQVKHALGGWSLDSAALQTMIVPWSRRVSNTAERHRSPTCSNRCEPIPPSTLRRASRWRPSPSASPIPRCSRPTPPAPTRWPWSTSTRLAHLRQVLHRLDMPNRGDEFHHFGWNACSSALSPMSGHAFLKRRYLIIPGIRSSRIYVVDTQPDPSRADDREGDRARGGHAQDRLLAPAHGALRPRRHLHQHARRRRRRRHARGRPASS